MNKVTEIKEGAKPGCPLTGAYCTEEYCAWWMPYQNKGGECCVTTLAKEIAFANMVVAGELEKETPDKIGGTD